MSSPLDTTPPFLTSFGHSVTVLCLSYIGCPKLHTVVGVRSHQCRAQWNNPFPQLSRNAVYDALQDMVGSFGYQGTLLTCIQFVVNQNPHIPFFRAVLQPLVHQSVPISRVAPSQMQNPTLAIAIFYVVDDCQLIYQDLSARCLHLQKSQ